MYCSSMKINFPSVYTSHSKCDTYSLLSLENGVANQKPAPLWDFLLDSIILLMLSLVTLPSHLALMFLNIISLTLFHKMQG